VTATGRKRPWLAAALALYPGLGHVYLREWIRALLWFGLIFTTGSLMVPSDVTPTTISYEAYVTAVGGVAPTAWLVVLGVTVLSMADAYWMARKANSEPVDPTVDNCPACGKELDGDIAFCPWCATDIAEAE
jgi:hypothetical protein